MQSDLFIPAPRELAPLAANEPARRRARPKSRSPFGGAVDAVDAMEAKNRTVAEALFAAMVDKAKAAGEVSGDDATLWLRANAPHLDPRFAGGVFRRKGWHFKRWKTTSIAGRHTRPLRVWEWRGA